jgi:hypothetical protein
MHMHICAYTHTWRQSVTPEKITARVCDVNCRECGLFLGLRLRNVDVLFDQEASQQHRRTSGQMSATTHGINPQEQGDATVVERAATCTASNPQEQENKENDLVFGACGTDNGGGVADSDGGRAGGQFRHRHTSYSPNLESTQPPAETMSAGANFGSAGANFGSAGANFQNADDDHDLQEEEEEEEDDDDDDDEEEEDDDELGPHEVASLLGAFFE